MFAKRYCCLVHLALILSAFSSVTLAAKLSLIEKTSRISNTTAIYLESIQFEDGGETFHFPKELQPLSKHPLIADLPEVNELFKYLVQSSPEPRQSLDLPKELEEFYSEVTKNFTTGAKLLEEVSSIMRAIKPWDGKIDKSVALKYIGCPLKGTSNTSNTHRDSGPGHDVLCLLKLLSDQVSEKKRLEKEISHIEHVIFDLRMKFSRMEVKKPSSSYIWRISNYAEKVRKVLSGDNSSLESEPFLTSTYGYKLRAELFLDDNLQIYIQLLQGDFDALLEWPFRKEITFTLMDQTDKPEEAQHITKEFLADDETRGDPRGSKEFQRPSRVPLTAWNHPILIPRGVLGQGRFLKDDTLFIKIDVA